MRHQGPTQRGDRPRPTPKSREATLEGTSVRFRSGARAYVTEPSNEDLYRAWNQAVLGLPGDRVIGVTVADLSLPGWPERTDIIDLTAIEAIEGVQP